jgi:excisionase family DNA binding protein
MSTPSPAQNKREQLTLFWESEVVSNNDGSVTLRASKPLSHMSVRQAAKVIGAGEDTIYQLFRRGMLRGYKPGAVVLVKSNGRASNAKLRLCSESVLMYKERQLQAALDYQMSYGG